MLGRTNAGGGSNINKSQIFVKGPPEAAMTCIQNGKTFTPKRKEDNWIFSGLELGQWTISGNCNGKSQQINGDIKKLGVFYYRMTFFTSTIHIITTRGATCSCKCDGNYVEGIADNNGVCDLQIDENTIWEVKAQRGIDINQQIIYSATQEGSQTVQLPINILTLYQNNQFCPGYNFGGDPKRWKENLPQGKVEFFPTYIRISCMTTFQRYKGYGACLLYHGYESLPVDMFKGYKYLSAEASFEYDPAIDDKRILDDFVRVCDSNSSTQKDRFDYRYGEVFTITCGIEYKVTNHQYIGVYAYCETQGRVRINKIWAHN